jgi:hypothetical protein
MGNRPEGMGERPMKKAIYIVLILVAAILASSYSHQIYVYFKYVLPAKHRVDEMLSSLQGQFVKENVAMSQWAKGESVMNKEDIEHYKLYFDDFRTEKNIYYGVTSYTIDDITIVNPDGERYARVSCTINGMPLVMIVKKDQPIAWAN